MDNREQDPAGTPVVTEADRAYFRRLAAFEAANERDAWAELESLSPDERWRRSARRAIRPRTEEEVERHLREDDPSVIYRQARKLGLYRD